MSVLFLFQENCEKTGEKPERMTQKDAAMFPIIASCALFGIYIVFKVTLISGFPNLA